MKNDIKVALVCIAKNEDPYIDEWIKYYIKLGIDHIFIYRNDWQYDFSKYEKVTDFITPSGNYQQVPSYNRWLNDFGSKYDFACFFDVDEFLVLKKHNSISEFCSDYIDCSSFGVNWRVFGDNNHKEVIDNDYSVIKRFTRCEKQIMFTTKLIVNLKASPYFRFVEPHFGISPTRDYVAVDMRKNPMYVYYSKSDLNKLQEIAQLNHYRTKTYQEFVARRNKGEAFTYPPDEHDIDKFFTAQNRNDVEDLTALKFFTQND